MVLVDQDGVRGIGVGNGLARVFHAASVLGDGDDFKILVFELLVDRLPSWQVQVAASPGGPGDEKDFLAAKIGERMRLAVHVGQGEIRRAQRSQALLLVGAQAEIPGREGRVMRHRLMHQRGKSREVEPGYRRTTVEEFLLTRLRQRETQLVAAHALRLYFKAGRTRTIKGADPEWSVPVRVLCGIDLSNLVLVNDGRVNILGDRRQSRQQRQQKDARGKTCFHRQPPECGSNYSRFP